MSNQQMYLVEQADAWIERLSLDELNDLAQEQDREGGRSVSVEEALAIAEETAYPPMTWRAQMSEYGPSSPLALAAAMQ